MIIRLDWFTLLKIFDGNKSLPGGTTTHRWDMIWGVKEDHHSLPAVPMTSCRHEPLLRLGGRVPGTREDITGMSCPPGVRQ